MMNEPHIGIDERATYRPSLARMSWTLTSHPLSLTPVGLDRPPAALAASPSNFSVFNAGLLPTDDRLLLFFRVSNMHFCAGEPPRTSWLDSIRLETHIRSYLAVAEVDAFSFELRAAGSVLHDAVSLFRTEGEACSYHFGAEAGLRGTFSGLEDPRPFWSPSSGAVPRSPWLLASAWSDDCARLRMHLIKLPPLGSSHDDESPWTRASQLPLLVDAWPANTEAWLKSPMAHPESEPIQKNWLPFVHKGELLIEYRLEPHVVLHVDSTSGRCVPLSCEPSAAQLTAVGPSSHRAQLACLIRPGIAFPSFEPLWNVEAEYGRVSGGAPPIHLPAYNVYLGLAHVKESRSMPHHIGTDRMVYHHFFYAFDDAPPFSIIAKGSLRWLPEPPQQAAEEAKAAASNRSNAAPTVQFASGMVLNSAGDELTISYSVLDCGVRLTRVPLAEVLSDIALIW